MEIHVIRHAPVAVPAGMCYGQSDVALAQDAASIPLNYHPLSSTSFDKVFTSPLSRCTLLAEALGFKTALQESRLMELNFGDWELRAWSALPPDETQPWMEDFVNVSPPNGESFAHLFHRVSSFYQELKTLPGERVLLITHAGVIRCLWALILEIPLKNAFKIPVNYGETLVIDTAYDTIQRKC